MRVAVRSSLMIVLAAAALHGVLAGPAQAACTRKLVPTPALSSSDAQFRGVAGLSGSDIWAVGVNVVSAGQGQVLIEHFNGKTWALMPGTNPGANSDTLYGVTDKGTSDV